jgi:plasmid stabilization system protein ParE
LLANNPTVGHPIAGHENYRQVVLRVLNAAYVLQYRIDGNRLVILRVFHGRESRDI